MNLISQHLCHLFYCYFFTQQSSCIRLCVPFSWCVLFVSVVPSTVPAILEALSKQERSYIVDVIFTISLLLGTRGYIMRQLCHRLMTLEI